jgi:hypothetical protein
MDCSITIGTRKWRYNMKYLPVISALIIGLFLGNWWPQSELRIARKKIAKLEEDLSKKAQPLNPMMTNVTSMLGVTSQRKHPSNKDSASSPKIRKPTPARSRHEDPTPTSEPGEKEILNPEDFENMDEFMAAARELWEIRSTATREALIDSLDLTEDEIRDFDRIISAMNANLETEMKSIADEITSGNPMTSETGLLIVNHLSNIVLNTYNNLDDTFPEHWREEVPEDTDIMNFIDPGVISPFLEIEGFMETEEK